MTIQSIKCLYICISVIFFPTINYGFVDPPIVSNPLPICFGESVTLTPSGCNGTTKWYADDMGTILLATGETFVTTPNESKVYYVGCFVEGIISDLFQVIPLEDI